VSDGCTKKEEAMMYGGEYMKKGKEGKAHEAKESETEKYREYGCVGPSPTFSQILATYKKGK
jgi:hypothetical protein